MEGLQYRIRYDQSVLPAELFELVEEITVEQEIENAWEARIKLPLPVDESGRWSQIQTGGFDTLPRIRVELSLGGESYTALIDGSLISVETPQSPLPGQSSMTLTVQDDTFYMSRSPRVERYDASDLTAIVTEVFEEVDTVAATQIDPIENDREDTPSREITRRETAIAFLRKLAEPIDFYAYLKPGEDFGESIGCFRQAPVALDGEPYEPLILLGEEQNIVSFRATDTSPNAATILASAVAATREEMQSTSSSGDESERLGDQPATPPANRQTRMAHPDEVTPEGAERLTGTRARRSNYTWEVSGQTNHNCYPSVLFPYHTILVGGVGGNTSGEYLIFKITHQISRSGYSQSFVLKRDASTESSSSSEGTGGVF